MPAADLPATQRELLLRDTKYRLAARTTREFLFSHGAAPNGVRGSGCEAHARERNPSFRAPPWDDIKPSPIRRGHVLRLRLEDPGQDPAATPLATALARLAAIACGSTSTPATRRAPSFAAAIARKPEPQP